ncbi:MAG: hypothetical protein Q8R87_06225 [Anaerolineaceae bacterium]|nr:hypothetical protein [Anaerolineaceae bacterium]
MGYYILVDTTVDPQVETRVDEEQHDIIILTKDGFISEHYQGTESSPAVSTPIPAVNENTHFLLVTINGIQLSNST